MAKQESKSDFGQITRLPSKRYRARYTDPEGRMTVSKKGKASPLTHAAPHTFDGIGDARAWLVDERRLISSGTWTSPLARKQATEHAREAAKSNVFETYAWSWLAGRHDLRDSTRISYTNKISRHLVPTFGDMPLNEITVAKVRAWFNAYGDKTPTARAHAYQVLGSIMGQAEEDELILRSPVRVKKGGRTKVAREPQVLTMDELFALVEAMPEKHRALTLLCGFGGLRFGEAVALRRKDVDLEKGTVNITRGSVRVAGGKQAGPPKTEAGKRKVAVPAVVVTAIKDHLGTNITGGRDGLVFPGADGELLAPTALYGRAARTEKRGAKTYAKSGYGFYAAREAIGRPELHWHDLRRTAASIGAEHGATVKEIQTRLGHTTAAMALHYQQASEDRDRGIAERMQASIDARK